MLSILRKIFGSANDRAIKKLTAEIARINALESSIASLSDFEIKAKTSEFKERLSKGESLDSIIYEAFAVVREASKRVLGMRHFDVQLMGGLILHRGMIAEMRTGEGKTLVATLPAYLNALSGKGVHIVTVNDYLARRDAEWKGTLYNFLGLSVGVVVAGITEDERKAAYNADITYATNNELGFDYLRDNMRFSSESQVQRPFNFALIDEVDSILIDEARTPLIISGPMEDNEAIYNVINEIVKSLSKEFYDKDEKLRTISLNDIGITKVEELLRKVKLIKPETSLYDFDNMYLVHYINLSLKAHNLFRKDVDYIIQNNQVLIIDEFTGRIMEGRRFSEGLHQALEAKENVPIQNENQTLASITFQNYFRMYPKLSGMTGTAMTEAAEFKDIYNLEVIAVPTHNKVTRIDHDDEIYGTLEEKYDAVIKLIKDCYERGQPVLVGTVSIEKSELISSILTKNNITHNVLNAKHHDKEASFIAQAGRFKSVTIATNMAGRGTDIKLGGSPEMRIQEAINSGLSSDKLEAEIEKINKQAYEEKEKVINAGGLYVIGTERHENRRIDNQLRGRAGRQGDIGATKFFLSLEDDLMRIFASDKITSILRSLGLKGGEAIQHPMITRALEKAQHKVEAQNYEMRKNLLKFDNVMNDQRKVIYEQRNEILKSTNLTENLYEISNQILENLIQKFVSESLNREDWNFEALCKEIYRIYGLHVDHRSLSEKELDSKDIYSFFYELTRKMFEEKHASFGDETFHAVINYVMINTLDQVWKEHLLALDHLRQGVHLRAYGQKDPLNEYKREAFTMFEQMLENLLYLFVHRMAHLHLNTNVKKEELQFRSARKTKESRVDPALNNYNAGSLIETKLKPVKSHIKAEDRKSDEPSTWGKVSRNELCPCGSMKKYKYCHGQE